MQLIDPKEIDAYLAGFFPDNPRGAELLQLTLALALRKRPENMEELRDLPDNAPEWLRNKWPEGGPYYRFKPDAGLDDTVRHIADWIGAALLDNDEWLSKVDEQKRPKKLLKIGSLEVAIHEANKAMALKNQKLALTLGVNAGNATVVEKFDHGYTMVQLRTPEELDYESVKMGHCIGQGKYDEKLISGSHVYYSLRDGFNKPHATLGVDVASNALLQCRGAQNKPPVRQYMPFVQKFVKANHYKLTEGASHTGLIEQDGEYYDINNLPEGLKWRGNLDLHGCTSLTHLGDHITVSGNLDLRGCSYLAHLGNHISVGRDLNLYVCKSLTHLGNHISVGRDLNLYVCKSLTHLGNRISVGRNLNLEDCNSLTHLGNHISVGSSHSVIVLRNCTSVTHLPDNLSVYGLDLGGCTSFKNLPKRLNVRGDLYADATGITEIPEDAQIGGKICGLEEKRKRLGWKPDQKPEAIKRTLLPEAIKRILNTGPQRRGRDRGDD